MSPTLAERAWTAGFLDGEGAVRLSGSRKVSQKIDVSACQVTRAPLERLLAIWGGYLVAGSPATANHRAQSLWRIGGARAVSLLRSIRPFLMVKGAHADLVMGLANLPGVAQRGYRLNNWDRAERASFSEAMGELNLRGREAMNARAN